MPLAPSFAPLLQTAPVGTDLSGVNARTLFIGLLAVGIGVTAAFVARALLALIALITHLSFQGRIGWTLADPGHSALGAWGEHAEPQRPAGRLARALARSASASD